MASFTLGYSLGIITGLAAAGLAGLSLFKRMLNYQRRARHAERLAELGTLTGGLAHEIKNPLSTVQLNLQLLQEDLPAENSAYARIVNRLNLVQRETARLGDILDDFLRYAGKIELTLASVDLNLLLEELVDFYAPQAAMSRIQTRLNPSQRPVVIEVDAKLIKQAVLNLMLNAVQAISQKDGHPGGELILGAQEFDDEIRIDVIDTGGGIPAEALAKIFDAYYSTKKSGTGLGLAMSRRIAEEHGGKITVNSAPGKGSNFQIHLPKKRK